MRLKRFSDAQGELAGYTFFCPGCNEIHTINTRWHFDGDYDKPTISPSILVQWDEGPMLRKMRCHSFIKNGEIQFLTDCTHALAGKTVPLPDRDIPVRLYEKEGTK